MATLKASAPLQASEWPAWVLRFNGGTYDDPEMQAAVSRGFRKWQSARGAWRLEHCPNLSGQLFADMADAESRRRAGITKRPTGPDVLSAGPRPVP